MKKLFFVFLAGLLVVLTSCNFPVKEPQINVQTAVAQTLAAGGSLPVVPTAVINTLPPATAQPALPTNTALPTLTPYPTYTPYPTATKIPCNQASWVGETVPDDTHFAANTTFTKTWTVTNSGSCTWTTSYKVVFDHGDAMGAPASINLPSAIAPGQTFVISINFKTPAAAGTYQGYWKLQDNNGTTFGLGPANNAFWVKVIVDVVAFTIKSATVTTQHYTVDSTCPYTFTFSADIVSTAAGTAVIWWSRSDGATSAPQNVTFSSASTVTITTTWTLSSSYSGWIAIYNDYPNHQIFDLQRANFSLTCTP